MSKQWHGWHDDLTTLHLSTAHPVTIAPVAFPHYYDGAGCIYSLALAAALQDVATRLFPRADLASDSQGARAMLVSQLSDMRRWTICWYLIAVIPRTACLRCCCNNGGRNE